MSDLISRQAAKDAIAEKVFHNLTDEFYGVMQVLNELPSTDRKGHWIEDETGNGFWICSSCGFVSEASGAWLLYKYCPNCGADMRGG